MTTPITTNFIARAPTMDDAQGVLGLINANDIAVTGAIDADLNSVIDEWKRPSVDLANDARVVIAPDGTIVGYEIVFHKGEDGKVITDGYSHPQYNGQGIGTQLLRWAEGCAREYMVTLSPDVRVSLRATIYGDDAPSVSLFEAEGFHSIRQFWRMEIELAAPPPAPEWPAGVTLRTFITGQDERATYDAETEAFHDHWDFSPMPYEEWLLTRVEADDFDPTLWFLAVDGDQIAGVARCRFRIGHGWVGSLSVRRPWRRKGVAMAILRHAFGEFYRRGERHVGLGVDSQNPTGATHLYERAGMHASRRFDTYEKELRAGVQQK